MTVYEEWKILINQAKRRKNGRVNFPEDEALLKMDKVLDNLCIIAADKMTDTEKNDFIEGLAINIA